MSGSRPSSDHASPSDGDLVRRALAGDYQGFEALVHRYGKLAAGIAFSVTGDYHGAADVAQDAFLKVHRRLSSLEDPERFGGWLRHIVRTTAIDWRRRVRSAQVSLSDREDEAVRISDGHRDANPVAAAERSELHSNLMKELAALPEHYREVLVLKYLEGQSYDQISITLGVSVETVESRLHRARSRLRKSGQRLLKTTEDQP